MGKMNEYSWYEPLTPQFQGISNVMPLKKFAAIEAVLHLFFLYGNGSDPRKAYLLFAQYQLIGTEQCTPLDHILQCVRNALGYYRSRKYWQDDFQDYLQDKYTAFRAFDMEVEEGQFCLVRMPDVYPYSYEKRLEEWQRFWSGTVQKREEMSTAEKGRYTYVYIGGNGGEPEKVTVQFPKTYTYPTAASRISGPTPTHEALTITLEELLDCAEQMAQKNPGDYCYGILKQNILKQVEDGHVTIASALEIRQVVNIVGMVGSGKSTLIKVLAYWSHLHQKRMVIVVDTVTEVLSLWQYLSELGVVCSPLIGRSERLKYINQIARPGESSLTSALSSYLTNSCLIDGMNEDREDSLAFGKEPCYSLKKGKNHLCPHFDICPGTRMLRECYTSSVVITTVAGFAVSRVGKNRELFLDEILRGMDVVVFDESDRVQKTLDHLFMPETSFDSYIKECADDCGNYMRLPSQKRESNRAIQRYDELQRQSVTVMSCILAALRQDLGNWEKITYGDSFSALTLLDNLKNDSKYKISKHIYKTLYTLIDLEEGDEAAHPLWKTLRASCHSTDFLLFDQLYTEWRWNNRKEFDETMSKHTAHILDARLKLILCLIYFDYFIRDLSEAYEACHETSYGQNELFGFLQSRFQEQQRILPSALCGNLFGMKKTGAEDIVLFRQYAFGRSLMNDLPYLQTDTDGRPMGPHVILLSGSSWAEGSYEYHVNRPVCYILEADKEKREFLEKTRFYESGFVERVSGSGENRMENLKIVTQKSVSLIIQEYDRNAGKMLLIVNSYEQAAKVHEVLQKALNQKRPDIKVCHMISDAINLQDCAGTIRRGEVSRFASSEETILIAPAMAIERGHNIVDETGHSALGAVFFMVRPLSVPDDVQEKGSKLNGYIESHCKREVHESVFTYNERIRKLATKRWAVINGSRAYGLKELDAEAQKDIVATLFILILQIFGRLARVTDTTKPAPHVYFIDGAFRRNIDRPNDFDCLEALGRYLDAMMEEHTSAEIAKTLYEPFYKAFRGGIDYEK